MANEVDEYIHNDRVGDHYHDRGPDNDNDPADHDDPPTGNDTATVTCENGIVYTINGPCRHCGRHHVHHRRASPGV